MLEKFCLTAVITLALLAEFSPVAIHAQTDQSAASAVSLVGSYKLLTITRKLLDTGEVTDPFGKQPSGYIVYTPNGRMLGVGPLGRTGADLTFDRQAGLSKDESSWPGIDPTASNSSVRSRKNFWLAIRSTVWRNATTSRAI